MLTVLTGAADVVIAGGDADRFQGGGVRVGVGRGREERVGGRAGTETETALLNFSHVLSLESAVSLC